MPGSHRLSLRRLKWEYRKSINAKNMDDGHSEDGSFRVSEAEIADLGLPHPEVLTVKAGSLIIANTHGFHRRGHGCQSASRLEVWTQSRPWPFWPSPGLPKNWLLARRYKARQRAWARRDQTFSQSPEKHPFPCVDNALLSTRNTDRIVSSRTHVFPAK